MSKATADKKGALISPLITFFAVVGIILVGIIFWVLFKALLGSNGINEKIEADRTGVTTAMNNMLARDITVEKDGKETTLTYGELIALAADNKEWKETMREEIKRADELQIGKLATGDPTSWGLRINSEDGDIMMEEGEFPGGSIGYTKTGVYTEHYIPTLKGEVVTLKYYLIEYHFEQESLK